MDASALRRIYLEFFRERGHAIVGGAPLVPEHDPSVLFTTAGMHPLVPFLLGEPHPAGKRLVNYQKCVRTDDILEVGDEVHLTFFEMLGNWSLGDYWKDAAIRWSYEFLTERLGLDAERLYVTCFAGDEDAPRDDEAAAVWRDLGISDERITFLAKKDNWWGPAGAVGPCGPDTEMFYDMQPDGPAGENPASNTVRFWELWNDVFMQYDKQPDGRYTPLRQRNVDTGMGVERTLAVLTGAPSVYETGLFAPTIERARSLARKDDVYALRIVADHTRAATFILAEGILPGNLDQPYVARRLIRRAVRYGRELGIRGHFLGTLSEVVIEVMGDAYPELPQHRDHILLALDDEEARFQRTLERGEREFAKTVERARVEGQRALRGGGVSAL